MRNILTFFALFFLCSLSAQVNNIYANAGIAVTVGAPTYKPGAKGSIVAIDSVTGTWYVSRDRYAANGSWLSMGQRIEQISGCSAPAYTPNKYNSDLVINNCAVPELYYHSGGGVWVQLNASGSTYTAGTGIAISGSNVISNTAPDQTVSLTGAGGNVITGTYPSFTITGTPATGSETIVTAGTGASVTGSGTSGSPYIVSSTITQYTDEAAQDAVGAMADGTLVYVDGTPLLTRAALTGDATASQGSNALTIANSAVTLAKQADVATATVFYRKTAGTGAPEVQTLATLKTDLGLTGTNSGDFTLNGLTPTTQTFATGTAGTDFAISSATSTHTFNLPTASASNRGALSSADWTTFNNKVSSLWTDAGALTYLTATGDNAVIGQTTQPSSAYKLQVVGGGYIKGAGATSATSSLLIEDSGGAGILNVRNDGKTGIGKSVSVASGGSYFPISMNADMGYQIFVGNTSGGNATAGGLIGEIFFTGTSSFGLGTRGTSLSLFNNNSSSNNNLTGGFFSCRLNNAGSRANTLIGMHGVAFNDGATGGTTPTVAAIRGEFYNGAAGHTLTNAYGLQIIDISANAGTITNTYGVHVGDITIGTQTNVPYSYISTDANARQGFSGNTQLGGTGTPARTADIVGEMRVSDLTTDTPTKIVGADADGDFGGITVSTGLTLSGGNLTVTNTLTAGTYTPTLTGVTNVTSSTAKNCQYSRNGNIVTVFGSLDVTTTLAIATEVGISLPIASALAAATDLNGTANASSAIASNGYTEADATNDRASLKFIGLSVGGAGTLFFSFSYTVL